MLLPHCGQVGGGHECGGPSMSPPHSLTSITLYLNIPPGHISQELPSIQIRASMVGT